MAVCCDHLVHVLAGLLSLPVSSSRRALVSRPGEVLIAPALAPMGPLQALKEGDLVRLGRTIASTRPRRKIRGMLGTEDGNAAECTAKRACSPPSTIASISASRWNLTRVRGLEATCFPCEARIASSP